MRVKKPKTGEHNARTSEEALGIIREMAGRWSDASIAACLNRMGMPTGQGKTRNVKRVSSIRRVNDIHGYLSADKDGPWRTMTEAAKELGITNHVNRRLIKRRHSAGKSGGGRRAVPNPNYRLAFGQGQKCPRAKRTSVSR